MDRFKTVVRYFLMKMPRVIHGCASHVCSGVSGRNRIVHLHGIKVCSYREEQKSRISIASREPPRSPYLAGNSMPNASVKVVETQFSRRTTSHTTIADEPDLKETHPISRHGQQQQVIQDANHCEIPQPEATPTCLTDLSVELRARGRLHLR